MVVTLTWWGGPYGWIKNIYTYMHNCTNHFIKQCCNIQSKVNRKSFTSSPACYVLPYRHDYRFRDIILQRQLKVLRINYRILKQGFIILPNGKSLVWLTLSNCCEIITKLGLIWWNKNTKSKIIKILMRLNISNKMFKFYKSISFYYKYDIIICEILKENSKSWLPQLR